MIRQTLAFAAIAALSANVSALDMASFLSTPHKHFANYNYAEANWLFQPDDFHGFELRGSRPIKENVALVGGFSRVSAEVASIDVTDTTVAVGARYFFAPERIAIENTDLDLSASLVNRRSVAKSRSDSVTGILLKGQARYMLNKPLAGSTMSFEELYGGLQVGIYSEDSGVGVHGGVLVKINQQFSAQAELLIDDGTYLSLGVRMKLGQPQLNPNDPRAVVPAASGSVIQPRVEPIAPVIEPPKPAPIQEAPAAASKPSEAEANPYGLSEDEMEGLKAATEQ